MFEVTTTLRSMSRRFIATSPLPPASSPFDAAWVRRQREAHVIGRRGIERHLQGDGIV
jgi:hypothetical protein